MQLKELEDFIDWTISEAGKGTFSRPDTDITKRIFAQNIKLAEEVGELSAEVLGYTGFVRKEKVEKYSPETLGEEFADVIFSAIRLAKLMDIDIETELKNKMGKIKKRCSDIQ